MVKQRIKDPKLLWLIRKMLKAGIQEDGVWKKTENGTEQGNLASPVIANTYMHYVLVLWFEKITRRRSRGACELVIYADDFVATFQYKDDAIKFMAELKSRLAKFALELEPNKTRLLEFGRFAAGNREKRGEGKPETFDFLGFTHYCSTSAKGKFRVKRRTGRKKFSMKLKGLNLWLKKYRNHKTKELIAIFNAKLRGHYRYYGITDNYMCIADFYYKGMKMLFKWLNKRSQKKSYTWEGFNQMLSYYPVVTPKIYVSIYG